MIIYLALLRRHTVSLIGWESDGQWSVTIPIQLILLNTFLDEWQGLRMSVDLTENERNDKRKSIENDYYQLEPPSDNEKCRKDSTTSDKMEHTEIFVTVNGKKITPSTSDSPPVSPMSITESSNDLSSPVTHDVENQPEMKSVNDLPNAEESDKVADEPIITHVPDSPGSEDKPADILIKRTSSGKSPSKIPRYVGTKQKGSNRQIAYYMSLKRSEESQSKGDSKAKFYIQIQNSSNAYMHLLPKFGRSNIPSPSSSRAVSEASLLSIGDRSRDSTLSENSYLEPGDVVELKIDSKVDDDNVDDEIIEKENKEKSLGNENSLSKATLTGSLLSLDSNLEPDTVINTLYETLKHFNDDDWPSESSRQESMPPPICSSTTGTTSETTAVCSVEESESCSGSYTPPPIPSRFYGPEDVQSLEQPKSVPELDKSDDEAKMNEGCGSCVPSNAVHQDLERTSSEVSLVSRPIRHQWDYGLWNDVTG